MVYKVNIKALFEDEDNFQRHVLLSTYKEMRTQKDISSVIPVTEQPLVSGLIKSGRSLIHICANVVRFNINESSGKKKFSPGNLGQILLENKFYSDVSLVVGEKILPAHKHILSLHSEVFKAMFAHKMKENQNGIVKIEEFDSEVIEELLSHMYTGETENLHKIPREVFEAAHKYEIHELKYKCMEYFAFNLNYENVIDSLDLATIYDLGDLKTGAKAFIDNHEEEMCKEASFRQFLCRSLNVDTIAYTLKLCAKYKISRVKSFAFEFVRYHYKEVSDNEEYLDLFISHPILQREIYLHGCSKIPLITTNNNDA